MVARYLFLASPRSWAALVIESCIAAIGFSAGLLALLPIIGVTGVLVAGGLAALLLVVAGNGRATALRVGAAVLVLALFGFLAYEALAFGAMLSWSIPWWGFATVAVAAVLCVQWSSSLPRVHFVLPLGLFVLLCLWGWRVEDGTVRCEDHERLLAQSGVALLVPSVRSLEGCTNGTRARPTGHPRKLFAAGPRRFFATVQLNEQADATSTFDGGLCEIGLADGGASIVCDKDLPRLYALAYRADVNELVVGGGRLLRRLAGDAPFATLAQADPGNVGMIVHEPDKHRLVVFFDDMSHVATYDDNDLRQLESWPLHVTPEEFRYAPERQEGLYCFASTPLFPLAGRGYLSLAVGADLLSLRPLGASNQVPWAWLAFSDGCDFDPATRKAYVGVGTLGLVAVLDYDDGSLVKTYWAGFGVRPLLLDRTRQRLYAGNYLDGWMLELDASTGTQLRRWFVGRFVRHIVPAPDGAALLVTSSMGIVRVQTQMSV